jgi:hypothetical protein
MLAEAAPITTESVKPWQAGTGGGIIGFIVLVLDIIAWSKSLHPPQQRSMLSLRLFYARIMLTCCAS